MSEFARILSQIIERGKRERTFNIKDLAQQAQITPSYLSNLKQANRKPPAHKTLHKITEGLRRFDVPETDIHQLVNAYNRHHSNFQDESKLLESLIDEYKEEGTLFERVKQGVQTKGLVTRHSSAVREAATHALQGSGFFEGDHHEFINQALALLETAHKRGDRGGKIYITWFHHDLFDETFNRDRERIRDMLRSFLWADSPFQAFHMWAGDVTRSISVIVDFLAQYIGSSQCVLYEIPHGESLPEYLLVEGVGFVEARPLSEKHYWIRHELIDGESSPQAAELQALLRYCEYLLGPQAQRKPLVETNTPSRRFSITPVTQKLSETETQNSQNELLLIKSSLSARFRPLEELRDTLEASGVAGTQLEEYVSHHQQRVTAHQTRLQNGKERSIHEKEFLQKDFRETLTHLAPARQERERLLTCEARLLRAQILQVLEALSRHPHTHFALTDQEFLIRFSLSGNTAFLSFDHPDSIEDPPLQRDDSLVRAWTEHPDVVYQLRHEFNLLWKGVDPQWRSDTEQGRRNLLNFFITEPSKALLEADLPETELWTFLSDVLDRTASQDSESFLREVCMHEQGARKMLLLSETFPLLSMPVDVGPWDTGSAVRTRQLVFHALLRGIDQVQFILSEEQLERYWNHGEYGAQNFPHEWVVRHMRAFQTLLRTFPERISIAVLPTRQRFPVNLEIINDEYICIHKAETTVEQRGLVLRDKTLADALSAYITRRLFSTCPEHLKGTQQIAHWLERQFGLSDDRRE